MAGIPPAAIYGLSQGLVRGVALLTVPLLAHTLTPNDLGVYSVLSVSIVLLSQALNLGGSTGVIFAGSSSAELGYQVALRFFWLTLALTTLSAALLWLVGHEHSVLLLLSLFIAGQEGMHQLFFSVVRCKEHHWEYLALSLCKAVLLLVYPSYLLATGNVADLTDVLIAQLSVYSLLSVALIARARMTSAAKRLDFKRVLAVSLPMIPHSFSQWIVNSANYIIIGRILDAEAVAKYSLAYTASSFFLVATSGMANYYPPVILREYERWRSGRTRFEFFVFYSKLYFALYLLMLLCLEVDRIWFGMIRYHSAPMAIVFGAGCGAFYLLGAYYIYCCFAIKNEITGKLSAQTALVAVVSLMLSSILVSHAGIAGAGIATLSSYSLYYLLIKRSVDRIESANPSWRSHNGREILLLAISAAAIFGLSALLSLRWKG